MEPWEIFQAADTFILHNELNDRRAMRLALAIAIYSNPYSGKRPGIEEIFGYESSEIKPDSYYRDIENKAKAHFFPNGMK